MWTDAPEFWYTAVMEISRMQALGDELFERYESDDLHGVRAVAAAYRTALGDEDPGELADLTADAEGLDLEVAATLVEREPGTLDAVLQQADGVFVRFALSGEPNLPATAAFALRIKAGLLSNAKCSDEVAGVGERLTEFYVARGDAGRQDEMAAQAIEVAYMAISQLAFAVARDLLSAVSERMSGSESEAERVIWARAQMLHVAAILYSGDTSPLPPVLRDLHAGGSDSIAAIDELLSRWGRNPFWGGARVSALGNKLVILESLGQHNDSSEAQSALDAELDALQAGLDGLSSEISADLDVDEIRQALLT